MIFVVGSSGYIPIVHVIYRLTEFLLLLLRRKVLGAYVCT
jgi:hypothetical protein